MEGEELASYAEWLAHGSPSVYQLAWASTEDDIALVQAQCMAIVTDHGYGPPVFIWTMEAGPEADDALDRFALDATPEQAEVYRHIRALLREYQGWLVIAGAART
jgi:hypothetical protein